MLLSAGLSAQEVLDRGVFIITRGGVEVGREEFAIRAAALAQGQRGVRAFSTTRYRDREIQHALELTAEYRPLTFQQTESSAGRVIARYSAQLAGQRFSARLDSPEGETAREFPVSSQVVLLGDDVFHAFYFVPRDVAGGARSINLVRPRDARPLSATVQSRGADTVTVAGRTVTALRFIMRAQDGDEREFWVTQEGDLLRASIPARDLVATRAELPRT
jgi:hypothetical protein